MPTDQALGPLQLERVEDPGDAARAVATEIAELVRDAGRRNSTAVVGLATGTTMEPVYAELVRQHQADPFPAGAFAGALIDEYLGLRPQDPRRFRSWVHARLAPLGLPQEAIGGFNVDATPFGVECGARRYASWLASSGGIDLLLLGVGRNGHIGFNEPGAGPFSRARVVALADETREDAAGAFGSPDRVPCQAVTLGVRDLYAARRVRVLAFGSKKRDVLRRLGSEAPSSALPVSLLRDHPDARLYADGEALEAFAPVPPEA